MELNPHTSRIAQVAKALACTGLVLSLMACSNQTQPLGKPTQGALATLTFDNPSMGEGLKFSSEKRSLFSVPHVDGKPVFHLGTFGAFSVPLYSGPHVVKSTLTITSGTDARNPGLGMNFRAAPGRKYLLQANSYQREGLHRVILSEDGKPIQTKEVPYDSYQRMEPIPIPALVH
jgi:hypothetical protein